MPQGKHQRIVVDIAAGAGLLALDMINSENAAIDVFAVVGPRDRGVVGGIARLPDRY